MMNLKEPLKDKQGRVIFDISGEEKKNLTVQELLEKFEKDDDIQLDDKMILG